MSDLLLKNINELKQQRNAVILAHNYQPAQIQDLADFAGDSLGLSRQAAQTQADVIVFCGVQFMAETAAILSPQKSVIIPEKTAGCPMADMITVDQLRKIKSEHPDAVVVCYVNSSAEVKAESDYCCTSSNAVDVVESIEPDKKIIFVPDQHLGKHVQDKTGRKLILWPGYCPSHVYIKTQDIEKLRQENPGSVVLTHPECSEPVKEISDHLFSTGQMLNFVKQSQDNCFIIATEVGILHPLKKIRPDAKFIAASDKAVCPNMKKINLEKILWSLEDLEYKVEVPENIRERARKALDRMVAVLPTK